MRLERTYGCDDEEAVIRLRSLTDYWSKYGVKSQWTGQKARISGKVKGVKFDGDMDVGGGRVVANIKAGFLAEKLGGKQYVESKLEDYLNPANSLESLQARAR